MYLLVQRICVYSVCTSKNNKIRLDTSTWRVKKKSFKWYSNSMITFYSNVRLYKTKFGWRGLNENIIRKRSRWGDITPQASFFLWRIFVNRYSSLSHTKKRKNEKNIHSSEYVSFAKRFFFRCCMVKTYLNSNLSEKKNLRIFRCYCLRVYSLYILCTRFYRLEIIDGN